MYIYAYVYIYIYRSEGFALTGYDTPGCVEDGAWMLWIFFRRRRRRPPHLVIFFVMFRYFVVFHVLSYILLYFSCCFYVRCDNFYFLHFVIFAAVGGETIYIYIYIFSSLPFEPICHLLVQLYPLDTFLAVGPISQQRTKS